MVYAFQDRENLYLIMDLMPGGDLRYHLGKMRRFSEEQTSKLVWLWLIVTVVKNFLQLVLSQRWNICI